MIKYYLIHFKDHWERINHINDIKNKLQQHIEIEDGVNTKFVDLKDQTSFIKSVDEKLNIHHSFFKSGQIGCYLSHHQIIRKLIHKKNNNIDIGEFSVIFEDDVEIDNNFHSKVTEIINSLKSCSNNFDLIFLGNWNENHGNHKMNNIYFIDQNNQCFGTHALLINNDNLKKIYFNNCNIYHEIDSQYAVSLKKGHLNGYTIYPCIATQGNYKSNI